MRWIKTSDRFPEDNQLHPARLVQSGGYEYTTLAVEDMDVFIGEESHWLLTTIPERLKKTLEWLDETPSEEPNQEEMWKELEQIFFAQSGGNRVIPDYVMDIFKQSFTLKRK